MALAFEAMESALCEGRTTRVQVYEALLQMGLQAQEANLALERLVRSARASRYSLGIEAKRKRQKGYLGILIGALSASLVYCLHWPPVLYLICAGFPLLIGSIALVLGVFEGYRYRKSLA